MVCMMSYLNIICANSHIMKICFKQYVYTLVGLNWVPIHIQIKSSCNQFNHCSKPFI